MRVKVPFLETKECRTKVDRESVATGCHKGLFSQPRGQASDCHVSVSVLGPGQLDFVSEKDHLLSTQT